MRRLSRYPKSYQTLRDLKKSEKVLVKIELRSMGSDQGSKRREMALEGPRLEVEENTSSEELASEALALQLEEARGAPPKDMMTGEPSNKEVMELQLAAMNLLE